MNSELVAFLRARLDEDEALARDAAMAVGRTGYENGVLTDPPARFGDDLVLDGQNWVANYGQVKRRREQAGEKERTIADCGGFGTTRLAKHIARHDPARVLREISAKRRIVDAYADLRAEKQSGAMIGDLTDEYEGVVLPALALPYADHPDYRQEWTP